MPRGDGTGPQGRGPKTGKGLGPCNTPNDVFPPQGQNPMGSGRKRGPGMGQGSGRGAGKRSGQGTGRGSGNVGRNR